MRRSLLTAILILTCCSCAPSLTARRTVPAAYPVAGIHTIAVGDFSTARGDARWAGQLQRTIERGLRQESFYRVVDEEAADALLTGRVGTAFSSQRTEKKVTEQQGTGRYRDEVYYESGQRKTRRVEITETVTRSEPTVVQQAELALDLHLVRLPHETTLTDDRIVESKEERATGGASVRALPPKQRMFERLTDAAAKRVIANLVPHALDYTVRFEQNDACTEGIGKAKGGDLDGALVSWRAASDADPSNAAALYNQGVALESLGRYEEARTAYLAAQAITSNKRTAQALTRIERAIADRTRLQRQMEGRPPAASR